MPADLLAALVVIAVIAAWATALVIDSNYRASKEQA